MSKPEAHTIARPAADALAQHVAVGWGGVAWRRMCHQFVLKNLGVALFMTAFFVAYFHVLRHPVHAVSLMPLTALDDWIAFEPWALPVYASLWVYVAVPPIMQANVFDEARYGVWIGALCVTGLLIFYFWPSAVPRFDSSQFAGFAVLQGLDTAGNACPSLHVATAAFSAYWIDRLLRDLQAGRLMRTLNWAWLLLIAWSTLATKQHVVWDVLAGFLMGAIFAALSVRFALRRGLLSGLWSKAHRPMIVSSHQGVESLPGTTSMSTREMDA